MGQWITQQRTETMLLPNGVVIRDQCPMPPSALQRCLAQNLTPANWYELLNQRIFFWLDLDRLERQRHACGTPQYVMTIDATKLLKRYASQAELTPFNTGNARRAAARRSSASFVPYESWMQSKWESEALALQTKPRLPSHKPVELVIPDAVPDILDFVIEVQKFEV